MPRWLKPLSCGWVDAALKCRTTSLLKQVPRGLLAAEVSLTALSGM